MNSFNKISLNFNLKAKGLSFNHLRLNTIFLYVILDTTGFDEKMSTPSRSSSIIRAICTPSVGQIASLLVRLSRVGTLFQLGNDTTTLFGGDRNVFLRLQLGIKQS